MSKKPSRIPPFRLKKLNAMERQLEQELGTARAAGDAHKQAITLNNLGTVCTDKGEWDRALKRYLEAAAVVPDDAPLDDRVTPHGNAAAAARQLGDWDTALVHSLWIDALAGEADDDGQRGVADAAVALVRQALGTAFADRFDAALAQLPEEQRGRVRREAHLPNAADAESEQAAS